MENDVWSSLGNVVGKLGDIYLQTTTVKAQAAATQAATSASPSAVTAKANPNPLFGNWSIFPQNDTKGTQGNSTPFSFALSPMWLIVAGLLVVLLVFMRRA